MSKSNDRIRRRIEQETLPYLRKESWAINYHKVNGRYRAILLLAVVEADHKVVRALKTILMSILGEEPYIYTVKEDCFKEAFIAEFFKKKEVRQKQIDDRLFSYLEEIALSSTEDEIDCEVKDNNPGRDTSEELLRIAEIFS